MNSKTWTYIQSTGEVLRPDGSLACVGYAGRGEGRNNPALEHVADVGPLPRGNYSIGKMMARHPTAGLWVLRLTPDPSNDMHGRSGFLIHGDNKTHDASHGCIIAAAKARAEMSEGELIVKPEKDPISS